MIDIEKEQVVGFAQAVTLVPRRRGNKHLHVSTLYRWASRGVRGERLEVIQVGGSLCTSKEALQRFFDRLTKNNSPELVCSPSGHRQKCVLEAERSLTKDGL